MEKASVGRIVHYVGQGGTSKLNTCRAAIVTGTKDPKRPDVLSMCVFNPQMPLFKHGVQFDDEGKKTGTWHWPEPAEEGASAEAAPASS